MCHKSDTDTDDVFTYLGDSVHKQLQLSSNPYPNLQPRIYILLCHHLDKSIMTEAPDSSPLLALPVEIRQQIISYLLPHPESIRYHACKEWYLFPG